MIYYKHTPIFVVIIMKIFTQQEIKAIEAATIQEGVSTLDLIERAGAAKMAQMRCARPESYGKTDMMPM